MNFGNITACNSIYSKIVVEVVPCVIFRAENIIINYTYTGHFKC